MSTFDQVPAPKKMSRSKKAGLVGGGVFAGLIIIGIAAGGGGEKPAAAPVLATTTVAAQVNQEAIDKLQVCIDMTAGTRPYDPTLWDTALCGQYKGSLSSAAPPATEATTEPEDERAAEATTEPDDEPTAKATSEPTAKPTRKLSVSQQNAVEKAADYLSYSAFSRSGLIKQLKFEGFTTKQATYGVKKVGL